MVSPLIVDSPSAMRAWSRDVHRSGRSIALVPTMGALHDGHLALVDLARSHADVVVVSIFVNPLQFGDRADFDRYPQPIAADVAACAERGVAAVYTPTAATIYPVGFQTRVVPGELAATLEGASRPGHFDGVATIVTKLFAAARPDVAVFGEKDYQQFAIVRRLAADLDLGVEVIAGPTVRESDGLAMSSRNQRLTPVQRAAAACVPLALRAAIEATEAGGSIGTILEAAANAVAAEPLASTDYVAVFDARTLEQVAEFDEGRRQPANYRLGLAIRVGDVRLIDNADLFDSGVGIGVLEPIGDTGQQDE